jgi:hypothetical protein
VQLTFDNKYKVEKIVIKYNFISKQERKQITILSIANIRSLFEDKESRFSYGLSVAAKRHYFFVLL